MRINKHTHMCTYAHIPNPIHLRINITNHLFFCAYVCCVVSDTSFFCVAFTTRYKLSIVPILTYADVC